MTRNNQDKALTRCHWCSDDPEYIRYHDTEWGVPSTDARYLFEMLILESFQAGLSWLSILKRRASFRAVFFNFDAHRMAQLSDHDLEQLTSDTRIIRHRGKIFSARTNAQAWLQLDDPVDLIWSLTQGQPQVHHIDDHRDVPVTSNESVKLSQILKKNGFAFVGPTTCQAYLQATGVLMQHTTDCFRYAELTAD